MKRLLLVLFMLSMSSAVVMSSVFAQDGDTQTFTSNDGSLTLEYPADWFYSPSEGAHVFANTEALATSDLPDFVESGEMVLGILPAEFLPEAGLEVNSEPATVATMIATIFMNDPNEPVESNINGSSVVTITGSTENAEYYVSAIGYEGGTLTLIGVANLAEMDAAAEAFGAIAESIVYGAPEPIDVGNLGVITADNAGGLREVLDLSNGNYDIRQVAVSSDGTLVALNYYSYFEDAESDYGLSVIDVASGETLLQTDSPQFEDMIFSDDGSQILYTREEYDDDYNFVGAYEGFVDVATGESAETELQAISLYLDVNGEAVQLLAELAEDQTTAHIVIADPETADVATEFDLDLSSIWSVYDINADATALLVSTEDSIHTLDTGSGELSDPIYTSTAEYPEFDTAAFSPDGSLVAFTEYDTNTVHIIDVASGDLLASVDRSENYDTLGHATFNADGSILFIVERSGILVIEVASGELLADLPNIVDGNLEDFAISADGRILLGGGYESVMIWGVPGQ